MCDKGLTNVEDLNIYSICLEELFPIKAGFP